MSTRRHLLFAAKVLISAGLLAFILSKTDLQGVYDRLAAGRLDLACFAVALIVLNVPLVSIRWWILLSASREAGAFRMALAVKATFIGLFFGQMLPGAIGGDAVKAWIVYREGLRPGFVVSSVVVDRLSAVLGLVAIALASIHVIVSTGSRELGLSAAALAGALVVATAGCLLFIPMILKYVATLSSRFRKLYDMAVMVRKGLLSWQGAVAVLISIVIHVLTTYAVTVMATALLIPMSLSVALAVVPLSLLVAAIPVSVAGWGLREASMMLGFSAFGIRTEDAAILSIWLGLSVILSSIPGGFLWLSRPRAARSHAPNVPP